MNNNNWIYCRDELPKNFEIVDVAVHCEFGETSSNNLYRGFYDPDSDRWFEYNGDYSKYRDFVNNGWDDDLEELDHCIYNTVYAWRPLVECPEYKAPQSTQKVNVAFEKIFDKIAPGTVTVLSRHDRARLGIIFASQYVEYMLNQGKQVFVAAFNGPAECYFPERVKQNENIHFYYDPKGFDELSCKLEMLSALHAARRSGSEVWIFLDPTPVKFDTYLEALSDLRKHSEHENSYALFDIPQIRENNEYVNPTLDEIRQNATHYIHIQEKDNLYHVLSSYGYRFKAFQKGFGEYSFKEEF